MKATTLISALVFACGAFAQASESASTSVSAGGKSASKSGAQTSTAASTPTPQPSPTGGSDSLSESRTTLIPSTISEGCSSFLNKLNADKELAACLGPLANAVSAYSGSGGSASALPQTLDSLCAASNSCSHTAMRAKLTEFKDNCSDELGPNGDKTVIQDYDTMYTVIPFLEAICSKVDGTYCLLDSKAGSSAANTTSNAAVSTPVSSRRKRAQTVLVPNVNTYRSQGLMYLFATPDTDKDALCTKCTQQILAKYTAFQNFVQHALGTGKSPLLGGQGALWAAALEKCPEGFDQEIYKIANVQSPNEINSSGALPAFAGSIFTAVASALAVVALI